MLVLNKKLNKWFKTKFKGNVNDYIPFEQWLCGAVLQQYADTDHPKDSWISPGAEVRKRKTFVTGGPIDHRFGRIYQPGILFLLNTETEEYIEWETGQGDSEILLVENDVITYRVYDKIYQRTIKEKQLGVPNLIVKHEYVQDIHWAWTVK